MGEKKKARACKIKEHNLAQCHVCLNSKREREREVRREKDGQIVGWKGTGRERLGEKSNI